MQGKEILDIHQKSSTSSSVPVTIVDRWYLSTLAYTAAQHCESEDATCIFEWPDDLAPRPTAVVILDVDESTRNKRVDRRIDGFGEWERRLRESPQTGRRILRLMQRIQGLPIYTIDSGGSRLEVLRNAVDVLQKHIPMREQGSDLDYGTLNSLPSALDDKKPACMTLVMVGPHCSGKSTIGQAVAEALGWQFHQELGNVLRREERRGKDAHLLLMHKDSEGDTQETTWDEYVFGEEEKRDEASEGVNRVVETWHVRRGILVIHVK
jgi:thymidylate kinase